MTGAVLTVVALVVVAGVAVYSVRLLQGMVTRAFELIAAEHDANRTERDVLLDRIQSPFAAQHRLTPQGDAAPVVLDRDIDLEWAEQDESLVTVPEDLAFMEDERVE